MKKLMLLVMALIFASGGLFAQRYLPGMKGVEVAGGVVDFGKGYCTDLKYSRYDRYANRWVTGIGFANRSIKDMAGNIPVAQFTAEGGYYLNLLSDFRKIFFLSVGISAMAGYETVNWGKQSLPDGGVIQAKNNFIYGGAVSLEIETYLTDRFVLLLSCRERGLWGNDTDKFHNQIALGVKYIIN